MASNQLKLEVRRREEIVYQGEVDAISGVNKTGKFDVLPNHANFISLLEGEITIYESAGQRSIQIETDAILKVRENEVRIFLGVRR